MTNIINSIMETLDFDQAVSTRIYFAFKADFDANLEDTLAMCEEILSRTNNSIFDGAPSMFTYKVDKSEIFGEDGSFGWADQMDAQFKAEFN